jgi:transcriptional regulator with XRE-family HTH domain
MVSMTGDEIRTRREALGMSRQKLADAVGAKHSSVWAVENDKTPQGDRDGKTKRSILAYFEHRITRSASSQTEGLEATETNAQGSTAAEAPKPAQRRVRGRLITVQEPIYPEHWTVSFEWGAFKENDPCRVLGEPGAWKFVKHVVNTETGTSWVDVYGGNGGKGSYRSFDESRVVAPSTKRTRKMPGEDVDDKVWGLEIMTAKGEVLGTHKFTVYGDAKEWLETHEKPHMGDGMRARIINPRGTIILEYPDPSLFAAAVRDKIGVDV